MVDGAVPLVGRGGCGNEERVAEGGVVDDEIGADDAVAAESCLEGVDGEGGLGVEHIVPEEGVAGGDFVGGVVRGMDSVVDNGDVAIGGDGADGAGAGCVGVDVLASHGEHVAHASILLGEGDNNRLVRQHDVVDPGAVAAAADATVLGVAEGKGVGAGRERVGGAAPSHFARSVEHRLVVDEENELVVVGLRRDAVVESHAIGRGHVDGEVHVGILAVGGVLHRAEAVVAFVGMFGADGPGIGCRGAPSREIGVAAFEGLDKALANEYRQ